MPEDQVEKSEWQLYTDSESAWQAMIDAIKEATESIALEQFILTNDSAGARFIDCLAERARSGIKVRILCDEVGSFGLSRSNQSYFLRSAGAEIKFFNSIVPWSPNNEAVWYFRDHSKLLVVDSKIGFTGGVCIGDEMRSWRESTVRIEGAAVREMLASFEVMWNKTYHKIKYYFKRRKKDQEIGSFLYITNAPLPDKHYLYRELIRAIRSARHYIYLTTPYLLPDSRLLRALKRAAKRKIEVRLLVPHTTNHKILDIGMDTFFRDMLEHGIKIFRYPVSQFIHAKTGVIDGLWATVGSMNLDNLSLRYNFEGNIVSTDKQFAFEIERQFLDDLKISKQLTLPEWHARPLYRKILESFVWPIRKLL
ncbi:MAG: phospholipase D-like domain-containing protein [Patescibacteria group bacterium]